MSESAGDRETVTYRAREAVGVFADSEALEAAVDELEVSGFDRAAISVLATDRKVKERVGHLYATVAEAADDPRAPEAAFVSRHDRTEGEAAAIAIPFQIGGFAGASAMVAAGGTLAAAIAATILGGAVGSGLGALLALAVERNRANRVREQLAQGGLLLWVGTPDTAAEQRATAILEKHGATSVHVHTIERAWGTPDSPLHGVQVDPLLFEQDPEDH